MGDRLGAKRRQEIAGLERNNRAARQVEASAASPTATMLAASVARVRGVALGKPERVSQPCSGAIEIGPVPSARLQTSTSRPV